MKKHLILNIFIVIALLIAGCSTSSRAPQSLPAIVVNTLEDIENPPDGTVSLRSALADAASGQPIVFAAKLDGGTIELPIVGDDHSILVGEVMGIRNEPSGPVSYLVGYFDRDYVKSAELSLWRPVQKK